MKRTKYLLRNESITLMDLYEIEKYFTKEELDDLNTKVSTVLANLRLENFESRAFAEKMFRIGYLTAHADLPNLHKK